MHSYNGEPDFSAIAAKADFLKREYADIILRHLPQLFLGAEMLLLAGWQQYRSRSMDRSSGQFSACSRILQTFVSQVGRWYKIPPEVRKRLVAMDELTVD
jgi:hypothetical protein